MQHWQIGLFVWRAEMPNEERDVTFLRELIDLLNEDLIDTMAQISEAQTQVRRLETQVDNVLHRVRAYMYATICIVVAVVLVIVAI